jgi:predicted transcriptional regulator
MSVAAAPKQDALDAITRLPDNADMDQIMYRLYVLESIRRGQRDADNGDSITHQDLRQEMQAW